VNAIKELESYAFDPACVLFLPLWRMDGSSFASQDKYGHLCTKHGNPYWTPQGWVFDGDDDAVTCGNGISLDMAALTVSFVIAIAAFQDWQRLMSFPNTFTHPYIIGETNTDGKLGFTWGTDADHSRRMPTALQAGKRYFFTITYENDAPSIYIDGVLEAIEAVGDYHSFAGGEVTIANTSDYNAGAACTLPLVMAFNRVLTPQEISRHAIMAKEVFA